MTQQYILGALSELISLLEPLLAVKVRLPELHWDRRRQLSR